MWYSFIKYARVRTFNVFNEHLPDRLCDIVRRMTRESVVQVPDEKISIIFWQSHERSAHHDEFHFVHAVPELLQLRNELSHFNLVTNLILIQTNSSETKS